MMSHVDHPPIEPSESQFEEAKILVQIDVIRQLNERLMWNLDDNGAATKFVETGLRQTCRDLFEGEDQNEEVVNFLKEHQLGKAAQKIVELLLTESKTLAA
jgi:hypothetical protein